MYTWAFRRTQLQGGSDIPGCSWMGNSNRENRGAEYIESVPCSPHRPGFHQHRIPRQCPVCGTVLLVWYAPEDPPASKTAVLSYRYKIAASIRKSEINIKHFTSLYFLIIFVILSIKAILEKWKEYRMF